MTKSEYRDLMNKCSPVGIVVNATNQCNLRCPYCFTEHRPQRMSLETMRQTLQWFLKMRENKYNDSHPHINWFGGEPMLEFDSLIVPFMEECRANELAINWGITTNCTLLTPSRIKFFEEFKTPILCSLDGTPEIQDKQRPKADGKGSFNDIAPILSILSDYPYGTIFRSTVTPENCDKLFEGYCFAKLNGFTKYYAGLDFTSQNWTSEKMEIVGENLFQICLDIYYDIIENRNPVIFTPLNNSIREFFTTSEFLKHDLLRCGIGVSSYGISPDGKIFGCQEHSTYENEQDDIFYIGDIYNGIDEERHLRLINKYINDMEKFFDKQNCEDCDGRFHCAMGSCPSLSNRLFNDFSKNPEAFCEYRRILGRITRILLMKAKIDNKTKEFSEYFSQHMEVN